MGNGTGHEERKAEEIVGLFKRKPSKQETGETQRAGAGEETHPSRSPEPATYPLNPDGPLCPLLDNPALLFEFYETAGLRKELKKVCKNERWDGKPAVPYSIGPAALTSLLHSLLQSPAMRRRIAARDSGPGHSPALHQAIWAWVAVRNSKLVELAEKHTHEVKDRLFMAPSAFREMIQKAREENLLDENGPLQLACLAVAFAMLQRDDARELLQVVTDLHPEYGKALGLEF